MKQTILSLTAGALLSLSLSASAATFYVDVNNPAPVSPYTNWVSAATNIQDAVDAAVDGDQILVTNGVYATGGRVYGMTNRVAVTNAITVQSVNGPDVTLIVGYQVPTIRYGAAAVRCVYLTNGAVLAGFTLTNGATQSSGNGSGGGVCCASASAIVSNCVIVSNAAYSTGGGAYSGTLNNCTLSGNSASGAYSSTLNNCQLIGNWGGNGGGANNCTLNNCMLSGNGAYGAEGGSGGDGGGAYNCTLRNCTVTGNAGYFYSLGAYGPGRGGGTYGSTLYNCIVYYNSSGGNYYGGSFNYCCTTPLPGGTGNTNADPQLTCASHLSVNSPCRRTGSATYASGVDIDREPWASPPSIGCDEYWSGSATGALNVAILASPIYTVAGSNVTFQAMIDGRTTASSWDLGSGVVISNEPYVSKSWPAAGDYTVALRAYNETYPDGVATNITIHVVSAHYVAAGNPSPAWPYISWATAATSIQDAVDASSGLAKTVWVSNGVYEAGARAVYGMTNRVAVTNAMTVQSVNGPGVTFIKGNGLYGPQAIRCIALTSNAVLSGFTLTNGAVTASGSADNYDGGGVWCAGRSTVVSNCVMVGNAAAWGGGAYGGTLYDCILCGNSASGYGGAAYACTLIQCTISNNLARGGGGLYSCTAWACTLIANRGSDYGGGADGATLNNCVVVRNTAPSGGGAYYGTLNNCTVTDNSANNGGGTYNGTLNNSIVYYNTATNGNYYAGTWKYCCATPLPGGSGNFATAPLFVNQAAGDLHLLPSSPCINKGNNLNAPDVTDMDAKPRIDSIIVDVGAYEFQGYSVFLAWLQAYGLPTNGSANGADTDADGLNNWQEWVAGTNPTNAASVLALEAPTVGAGGVTLTWASVTNRTYCVERATSLAPPLAFSVMETNIAGLPETTSYTDTNAPPEGPVFYRIEAGP